MMWLLDSLFDRIRWYRRLRGGHWERWHVDHPVNALVWHRLDECSVGGPRPTGICRGTPICDDRGSRA